MTSEALIHIVTPLLKNDTELFKKFMGNASSQGRLTNTYLSDV